MVAQVKVKAAQKWFLWPPALVPGPIGQPSGNGLSETLASPSLPTASPCSYLPGAVPGTGTPRVGQLHWAAFESNLVPAGLEDHRG